MKVKIGNIIKYAVYLILLLDCNFLMMTVIGRRFQIMVLLSILLLVAIGLVPKYKERIACEISGLNKYAVALIIMLAFHFIYAKLHNGTPTSVFLNSSHYYMIFFLAYSLVFVFSYDGGTDKFWKFITVFSFAWYSWLLIQYFAYGITGNIISPYLKQAGLLINNFRNGNLRLEIRVIGHLAIIYNFDRFYNQDRNRHKIVSLLMTIYGLIVMFLVEQTRGYQLAVLVAIAVLLACYNRKSKKFLFTFLIVIIAAVIIYRTQIVSSFIASIFEGDNATGYFRINGMQMFWNQFLKNPLWGYGFQPTGDYVYSSLGVRQFNDNGFVGILGQIGIWGFILFGMMVIRFGRIIVKLFKKKDFQRATILLGLYVYMLLTAISLICYWNSTCLLCPILWALFEYEYSQHLKVEGNNK